MSAIVPLKRGFPRVAVLCVCSLALAGTGCGEKQPAAPKPSAAPSAQAPRPAPIFADKGPAFPPDTLVVEVDGAKLTAGTMDKQIDQVLSMQRMQGLPPENVGAIKDQIAQRVADRFVGQQVLRTEAKRQNLQADAQAVSNAMVQIKSKIPAGMTLDKALADAGINPADFQKEMEMDLAVQKLIENRRAQLPKASDEEVAAFYKEQQKRFEVPELVHARHILVQCDEKADAAAHAQKKQEAEALRQQLTNGTDFAKLAKEHSDDPGSKEQGGDLGPFARGSMVKEFEDAAFSQATNEVGPLVTTRYGYHIIQVISHEQSKTQSFDEVKAKIGDFLSGQKQGDAMNAYLEELKKKSTIKYGPAAPKSNAPRPVAAPRIVPMPAKPSQPAK